MGDYRLMEYYEECLKEQHFAMDDEAIERTRKLFKEKQGYADYNDEKPFEEFWSEGNYDELEICEFDKTNFPFLEKVTEYDSFVSGRHAFFEFVDKKSYDTIWNDSSQDATVVNSYIESYQDMLAGVMRYASKCETELEKADIKRFLGIVLLLDCIKSSRERTVYLTWINPIMLLQTQKVRKFFGEEQEETQADFINILKRKVSAMYLDTKFTKKIYSDSAIYTIDRKKCLLKEYGLLVAKQIRTMSTINDIDSIRIWEKVLKAWKNKKGEEQISVAYFGEFNDNNTDRRLNIEKYLDLDIVKKRYGISADQVEFVHFKSPDAGEIDFYQSGGEFVEYYNLQDMSHIERLLKKYDIVFLLDQGNYYRKALKESQESYESAYEIYSLIKRIAQAPANNKNGNDYRFRQAALKYWMNWGFAFFNDKSGKYEFSKNLYNNIRLHSEKDQFDVYAYISEGNKIGNIDLDSNNVCRGELYYGNRVVVSHLTSNDGDDDISSLLEKQEFKYSVRMTVWRLLKVLYDKCYKELYDEWKEALNEKNRTEMIIVYILQRMIIEWDYGEIVKKNAQKKAILLKILYYSDIIDIFENQDEQIRIMGKIKEYIEKIFNTAFSKEPDVVGTYFKTVITETVKSSSSRLEDFLFAHYLEYDRTVYGVVCEVDKNPIADEETEKSILSIQMRQAIHAIIKQLDTMHIREVERGGKYIKQDIIEKCCKNLGEKELEDLLRKMKQLKGEAFEHNDLLTHNISILCQE